MTNETLTVIAGYISLGVVAVCAVGAVAVAVVAIWKEYRGE